MFKPVFRTLHVKHADDVISLAHTEMRLQTVSKRFYRVLGMKKHNLAAKNRCHKYRFWENKIRYSYHSRHVVQGAALLLVQLALDGRHPLQLLLSVTVAGDALLSFHSLLEKQKNGDTR